MLTAGDFIKKTQEFELLGLSEEPESLEASWKRSNSKKVK